MLIFQQQLEVVAEIFKLQMLMVPVVKIHRN
jgi:hypothetical protein